MRGQAPAGQGAGREPDRPGVASPQGRVGSRGGGARNSRCVIVAAPAPASTAAANHFVPDAYQLVPTRIRNSSVTTTRMPPVWMRRAARHERQHHEHRVQGNGRRANRIERAHRQRIDQVGDRPPGPRDRVLADMDEMLWADNIEHAHQHEAAEPDQTDRIAVHPASSGFGSSAMWGQAGGLASRPSLRCANALFPASPTGYTNRRPTRTVRLGMNRRISNCPDASPAPRSRADAAVRKHRRQLRVRPGAAAERRRAARVCSASAARRCAT